MLFFQFGGPQIISVSSMDIILRLFLSVHEEDFDFPPHNQLTNTNFLSSVPKGIQRSRKKLTLLLFPMFSHSRSKIHK